MESESLSKAVVLDHKAILKILPHRYPFLLVDRVVHLDLEKNHIIGQKNLTLNEEFFKGHFPIAPIMPGVLILEALAQTGGILIHKKGYEHKIALLMSVNNAKFRKPVLPGDVLFLHVEGGHFGSRGGKIKAHATVHGELVAEAEIGFGMMDKGQLEK
jgi:3-hydroxyacyl-[acyl-carrier-protein] dehydratase